MSNGQDVEINLGTGRLLGLFFALVVVCAIFFGLGYSLGKNSSSVPQPVTLTSGQTTSPAPGAKPHAASTAQQQQQTPASSNSDELTFFKTVEQKDAIAKLAPATANTPDAKAAPVPELAKPTGTYVVQVAAVTKEEDAQALVSALRKKNYPVFVVNNSPFDSLFHVQVGPFNGIDDAESMRSRLASDGYNPIVKK